MNRKKLALSAALGLLVPVLAGCGSSGGGSGGNVSIVVGTTDQFGATKENPAPLDPAFTYDTATWNILRHTLQTLTHVPRGGGQPVPEAASQCGFTDRQNESYRCKLRSDLTFSSGEKVTVQDVKYSIQRILDIHDPNGASGLLANIDTMETNGDAIVFHLKTPDATFPYKLATPVAGIVNPKEYPAKKLRAGFGLDGSGAYTFKPVVKNNELVSATFTKNPSYKGDLRIRNNKVEIRTYATPEAMGKALDSHDIDVMLRAMSPKQIKTFTENPPKDINLTEIPGDEIRYLGFDTAAPVVKNVAVRKAIAYVIDRTQLVGQVYGTTAKPLYSIIPAGIAGHTNSFFNEYGGTSNVTKAAAALQAAGIQTPVKLRLDYTTDHYGTATAKEFQVLQSQLNASKLFDVTIKGAPWETFRPAETKQDFDVYGMGWFPDFPDPDNYIAPFFDKDNFLGSPYNNKEIQQTLIPKSRRAADRGAAAETFGTIQDIVAAEVPVLPLWQGNQYIAARDDVTGVEWAADAGAEYHLWELSRGNIN